MDVAIAERLRLACGLALNGPSLMRSHHMNRQSVFSPITMPLLELLLRILRQSIIEEPESCRRLINRDGTRQASG